MDTRIARWWSIDPLDANYPSMSPYTMMGNNPIVLTDVNGDSIPTKFYNAKGVQVYEIPDQVQKMFQTEYGITVGYNKETEMLYYESDYKTNLEIPTSVRGYLEDYLCTRNSPENLTFGYNLSISINGGRQKVPIVGGRNTRKEFGATAILDLADFNEDGSHRSVYQLSPGAALSGSYDQFLDRSFNLARTFEHEFISHGFESLEDGFGPAEAYLFDNKMARSDLGLPMFVTNKPIVVYRKKMVGDNKPSIFNSKWRRSSQKRNGPYWNDSVTMLGFKSSGSMSYLITNGFRIHRKTTAKAVNNLNYNSK